MRDLTPLPDLVQGAGLTGAARTRRPVYVDLLPPCNAECLAGVNIQAWLAAARDGVTELRGLLSAEAGLTVPGRTGYLSAIERATHVFGSVPG